MLLVLAALGTFSFGGLGTAVAGHLTGPDGNGSLAFLTAAVVSMPAALVPGRTGPHDDVKCSRVHPEI
ncbi:hypothetical protein MF672_050260 [Actinomadura sp. ATCC 31491]|uniref:MFS transporter n=1 Tax=Actinomadura luzonensis TaxID=2805427 RepID=A0ABT0GBH6_9ACTN|nr:hypothetical protein [Actinomadura luzonensis]MCK2221942.1 hypothetical protein [Actinomadura luzonensis]